MPFYQQLVQPIDKTRPTEELLACSLMADLSYVRQEIVLENAMKLYLGTGNFEWFETPGNLQCNYVLTQQQDGIIVAFSGTENIAQFLYYTCTCLNIARPDLNFARCHTGFGDIASDVLADLKARIRPEWKFAPMTIIGHSLGGAVALIISAMLKVQPGYDIQNVVTFGAPAVGAFEFEGLIENLNKVLVANELDPVPYMPPEVGVKWRHPLTTPEIFAFYHFVPIFPWLLATNQGAYIRRDSNFANLPRALLTSVWRLLRDPNDTERTEQGAIIASHFMENYCARLVSFLKRNSAQINWQFYDMMFSLINGLRSPGQYVAEISQGQFNQLVAALGLNQGVVATPAMPNDPYLAFYAWAAGTRPDIIVEIGLYVNNLPPNEVKVSDIIEARFPGYRRAGNEAWAAKAAENNVDASAQSAICTWVQSTTGAPQIVKGVFVIMKHDGLQTLIGACKLSNPVTFGNIDAKVSVYCQPVAILSQVTLAAAARQQSLPSLYSFSWLLLDQMPATGEMTNFNSGIILPNPFAVGGDISSFAQTGAFRTWWEFRGADRRVVESGLDALNAIVKRDIKNSEAGSSRAPILDPENVDLQNAVSTMISQLSFCLMIVHSPESA